MTLKLKKWMLSASLLLLIVSALRLSEGLRQRSEPSATGSGEEDEYDSDDDADESADSLKQRIRNFAQNLSPGRPNRFQEAFDRNRISEALSVIQEETELTDSLLSAQSQQQSDYHDRLGELSDFRWLVNKFAESNPDVHSGSASAARKQSTGFALLYRNDSSLDKMDGGSPQSAGQASMPAVSRSMASVDEATMEMKDLNLSPQSAKKQYNAEQSTSRKSKTNANQEKQPAPEWYPSCRNSRGKPVEWFITIKRNMNWDFLSTTSRSTEPYNMTSDIRRSGPVWNTLTQALKRYRKPSHIVIAYNDQPPGGKSSQGYAHAKGVVMFDKVKKWGFWIVHSVPNFPVLGYPVLGFPASSHMYAQSFGCSAISDEKQFRGVISQLKSMKVYCYGGTTDDYPDFPNPQIPNRPYLSLVHLGKTKKIFQIAKVNEHNCCIYCKNSQYLEANMLTETWSHLKSGNHVQSDIKVFRVDFGNGFKYTVGQDHSKWSVSNNHRRPFVCVGDLNRQITARGGGVLCIESERAQKFFCRAASNANGQPFACV